jgi:hypothetical protein
MASQSIKGKKHGNGANTRRTEKRRSRRQSRVRDRISALNKLAQAQGGLSMQQKRTLTRLENYLDHPRKRAYGRRRGYHPTRNKWARMRSDLGGAFGKHGNPVSKQEMSWR